ncbi:MAG: HAD hydrolase-like protein, partial [Candidatus Omnitrophica bacterium]|nr:HAD hydrolase-like protein [Candidatus Omnitrophota bacterium]
MICNKERLGRVNFKESHTVISFDIFDTLLIRTIEPLEQIHHFVFDRAFLQRFGGIDRFQMLRAWKSIESRLRANAAQAGYDSECSDEEIIACLAQELGKEGVGTHDLLESALSIEKYFLEPMPNMRLLLERLAKHHRIIAISDTIFSARILSKLLESCGYANLIDRVYSSSDFKLSKASGRLFLKVLDEERVQKESICHIGDNALSDYCVPRHLGMQSILLYDEWNLKRKAELRILGRKRNGSAFFSGQTIISHVKSKDWQGNDKEKRLYEWGRDILGPLLTIFTHCLVNQIKKDAVHKLYFIAREGFLLQRIFSFFSLEFDERRLPESALVPVSRFTAFLSSIKSLGSRELAIAAWGNPDVDILLKRLGIDNPGEVIDCLDRYSLAIGDNCGSFLTRKCLYQLF